MMPACRLTTRTSTPVKTATTTADTACGTVVHSIQEFYILCVVASRLGRAKSHKLPFWKALQSRCEMLAALTTLSSHSLQATPRSAASFTPFGKINPNPAEIES
jgi:hypothetical protein